ncbi:hypothetical protein [Bordetella sp. 2513F-2]
MRLFPRNLAFAVLAMACTQQACLAAAPSDPIQKFRQEMLARAEYVPGNLVAITVRKHTDRLLATPAFLSYLMIHAPGTQFPSELADRLRSSGLWRLYALELERYVALIEKAMRASDDRACAMMSAALFAQEDTPVYVPLHALVSLSAQEITELFDIWYQATMLGIQPRQAAQPDDRQFRDALLPVLQGMQPADRALIQRVAGNPAAASDRAKCDAAILLWHHMLRADPVDRPVLFRYLLHTSPLPAGSPIAAGRRGPP